MYFYFKFYDRKTVIFIPEVYIHNCVNVRWTWRVHVPACIWKCVGNVMHFVVDDADERRVWLANTGDLLNVFRCRISLEQDDPRWVGAWWVGYLAIMVIILPIGSMFFGYPPEPATGLCWTHFFVYLTIIPDNLLNFEIWTAGLELNCKTMSSRPKERLRS